MKLPLKVIFFISFITVVSSFAGIEKKSNAEAANKLPLFSITVFTKPECYSGSCFVKELVSGTIIYPTSVGGNYYFQNGLYAGTWGVFVCCDGWYGSGTVVLDPGGELEQITIELQQGDCPYKD